jgi:tetratricopeptide (TPR) repeat protein
MIRRVVMAILLVGLLLFIVAVGVPYLDRTMLADQAVEEAMLACNQEDWPRAEERYSAAIRKLPPDSAEASRVYRARGAVREQMKRYDDAVADYARCLEIEPNSDTYWAQRGITYYKAGRYRLADADLERCLAINDCHTSACMYAGMSAERQGDLDRALHYYTRATTMTPVGPAPFAGMARVYAAKGDSTKAQENAARARAINPEMKLEID